MTAESLARSLIDQARQRLNLLSHAMQTGAWHIVVREAQECVELALKGMIRAAGLEPPKLHDISGFLSKHSRRIAQLHATLDITRLADISASLQKERELAFYGDIDFLPEQHYSRPDAETAIGGAAFCVEQAETALDGKA